MENKFRFILFGGFLLFLWGCAESDQFSPVQQRITELVSEGKIPSAAVAAARDGRIIWEQGFGYADRENNIKATEHTRYALASITKPFTCTALMKLREQGLIRLDDPIELHLNDIALTAGAGDPRAVTIRRTASHTAGLPLHSNHFYIDEMEKPPPFQETVRRYGIIVKEPGKGFQYSNLGYGLLGRLISAVSEMPYEEFMEKEIFIPLDLNDTCAGMQDPDKYDYAVKYTGKGDIVPPSVSDTPAGGMIYSSVHDVIRFAVMHCSPELIKKGAVLSPESVREMQVPAAETGPMRPWQEEGSGYGLGWNIGIIPGGLKIAFHSGGISGESAVTVLVPEKGIAAAVLTNTESPYTDDILFHIISLLLPEETENISVTKAAAGTGSDYTAEKRLFGIWQGHVHTYEGAVHLEIDIREKGGIFVSLGEEGPVPLEKISYQSDFPLFNSFGGGPFLRGVFEGSVGTDDVLRGNPGVLWLELKLRGDALSGGLIAFSQRKNPIGPLTHWVDTWKQ